VFLRRFKMRFVAHGKKGMIFEHSGHVFCIDNSIFDCVFNMGYEDGVDFTRAFILSELRGVIKKSRKNDLGCKNRFLNRLIKHIDIVTSYCNISENMRKLISMCADEAGEMTLGHTMPKKNRKDNINDNPRF